MSTKADARGHGRVEYIMTAHEQTQRNRVCTYLLYSLLPKDFTIQNLILPIISLLSFKVHFLKSTIMEDS